MTGPALTQLGRYRILAELGRGAMGVVYKAEDPLLNRTVAIKTIIMSGDAGERAEYEARFYQEAKAAGGLNHPNVITVHDIGREGEVAYMAMELVDGIDLREMMKTRRLPLPQALDILAQVADGLAFAHECGVVHRDVKPGNVMMARGRQAKIMDFGIARMRESDIHTRTGAILGSPKYMSPEQVSGMRTDHRSDIFSLGVMLYELVAGEPPFSAPQLAQLMQQIVNATPRPPSSINTSLPPVLDLIIVKALAKQADTRYQSAAELAADLRACLAALSPEQSALPAQSDATLRLDAGDADEAGDEATVRLDAAAATIQATSGWVKTVPLNADAKHPLVSRATVTSAAATLAPRTPRTRAADSGAHLLLSRRFESSAAMHQLAELSAADSGAGGVQTNGYSTSTGGAGSASVAARVRMALLHLQRDTERRTFVVAVTAAVVIALVIAFAG